MKTAVPYIDLFLQEHGGLQKELDLALEPQANYYIAAEVGNKLLKVSVDRIAYLKTFARYAEEEVGKFLSEYNILSADHPLQELHEHFCYIDFHDGPATVSDGDTNEVLDDEAAIVFFLECALQDFINLHELDEGVERFQGSGRV